jgi:hypothetical protein
MPRHILAPKFSFLAPFYFEFWRQSAKAPKIIVW